MRLFAARRHSWAEYADLILGNGVPVDGQQNQTRRPRFPTRTANSNVLKILATVTRRAAVVGGSYGTFRGQTPAEIDMYSLTPPQRDGRVARQQILCIKAVNMRARDASLTRVSVIPICFY